MKTRSKRTLATFALSGSLLLGSLAILPQPTQAVEGGDACQELLSPMNDNLRALLNEIGEIDSQVADVEGRIAKLENDYAALQKENEKLLQTILDLMADEDRLDRSATDLDALLSSGTLSEFWSKQERQEIVTSELDEQFEEFLKNAEEMEAALSEAKKERQDLLELKGQLEIRKSTLEAQETAKRAAEQLNVEECEAAQEASAKTEAEAIVQPPSNDSGGDDGGGSVSPIGNRPGNPYPYGQCTWYVYEATGRGQNGNAGTWGATSSTPGVGKIMIWRSGEQGAWGAGHVGVVVDVSGNNVTIQHMNWGGALGQVTTGTFRSTGKFY